MTVSLSPNTFPYVRVGNGIGGANARIRLVPEAREVFNL